MAAIFILATIIFFLTLDWGVARCRNRGLAAASATFWDSPDELPVSNGAFFAPGHTWVRLREDGMLKIGVDAFAVRAMGEPSAWELPAPGKKIRKGDTLITAVKGERSLAFASPVSGVIDATNPSPLPSGGDEWLLRVEPTRLGAELKVLRIAEEARGWLAREAARFREFLVDGMRVATATLPDGGIPAEGVLAFLPEDRWDAFEDEFLHTDD